jgi:hypothetical protein
VRNEKSESNDVVGVIYSILYIYAIGSLLISLAEALSSANSGIQLKIVVFGLYTLIILQFLRIYYLLHTFANSHSPLLALTLNCKSLGRLEKIIRLVIALFVVVILKSESDLIHENLDWIFYEMQLIFISLNERLSIMLGVVIGTGINTEGSAIGEFKFLLPTGIALFLFLFIWDCLICRVFNTSLKNFKHSVDDEVITEAIIFFLMKKRKSLEGEANKQKLTVKIENFRVNGISYIRTPRFYERLFAVLFMLTIVLNTAIGFGALSVIFAGIFGAIFVSLYLKSSMFLSSIFSPLKSLKTYLC